MVSRCGTHRVRDRYASCRSSLKWPCWSVVPTSGSSSPVTRRDAASGRDAPVTHTGSLTINGDGSVVAIARYGDGLCCYGARQSRPRILRAAAPCRLADVSYDGRVFVTASLDDRVSLRDANGIARADWALPARPVGILLLESRRRSGGIGTDERNDSRPCDERVVRRRSYRDQCLRSKTTLPPTRVSSTRVSAMWSRSAGDSTSRDNTTRSASLPRSRVPRSFS